MIGAQVSTSQREKIESYVKIGRDEDAEVLIGGKRPGLNGRLAGGYYFEPTVLKGHNAMRVFQEEIFGPVLAVTTFRPRRARGARDRERHAVRARRRRLDSRHQPYGPRDPGRARVEHCYHQYPAHAAFGGYKASGVCRENHRMMLDHYTQTKCLLVSYDPNPLGFF
jgi:aldehyde dehydrogenase